MPTRHNISISLVAPAHNEEELIEWAIKKFIADLSGVVADFEIIIIDDGSTDKTGEIASRLATEFKQLKLIRHKQKQGAGAATLTGIKSACKDYLFWVPVDMTLDTKDLPVLLAKLNKADMVIGYRPNRKANSLYRKITSYINYLLIRILSGLPIKDFQHVQIYPKKLFNEITINSRSTFLPPEVIIKACSKGYTFTQVQVACHPRTMGKSKCSSMKVIFRTLFEIFRYFTFERNMRQNPASRCIH